VAVIAVAFVVAVAIVIASTSGGSLDPVTYLAAGERLNAGHSLYTLSLGDRYVAPNPPYWTAPFVSPPSLAVLWRPIALLGNLALPLWWMICTVGVVVAVLAALDRPLLVFVLAIPLGTTLVLGNVDALLLAGMAALPRLRSRPWALGTSIALLAAAKLFPIALVAWLVAERRYRAVAAATAAGAVLFALTLVGAGTDSLLAYVDVARSTPPFPLSLAGLSGFGPAGWVAVIVAAAVAVAFPRWSFLVMSAGMIAWPPVAHLNTPAFLLASIHDAVATNRRQVAGGRRGARRPGLRRRRDGTDGIGGKRGEQAREHVRQ